MKIKRENLPKSRVRLTIKIEASKTDKFFEEAYKKLAPTVEIKGFRPGQAPRIMTLEAIGHGRYHQTALDIALPQTYYEAVQSEKIIPIQPPAVSVKEFNEGKDFIYEAEVDIVPEIKLGDYKKVKVNPPVGGKKKDLEVKKEEINKVIEKLRYQSAIFNEANRPAKKGDRVEINFDGFVDNVKQENLVSKNHPIILGEGTLIPGFEKELEGMGKEEEKEFDLNVPHSTDKSKSRKAHFKVKMLDVKETILPETNDVFSKKFGHDTMDKLTKAIENSILEEKIMRDKQQLEKEVLEKIIEKCQIDIPESMIEQEISRRLTEIQQQMGPGFPKYLQSLGKNIEDIRKEMRVSAEKSVKIGLVLGEISKAEGIYKHTHDPKEQQEFIRKTVDKLVEEAIK